MNRQKLEERARRIYTEQQAAKVNWDKTGITIPAGSLMSATQEQIVTHLVNCAEITETTGVPLDAGKLWGKTREELETIAAAKHEQYNRRAGVRALKAKYGDEAAERIVSKHAGGTST